MTVEQYLDEHPEISTRELDRRSGVSEATIRNLKRGAGNAVYENALRLQIATGGLVTIADVCDPRGEVGRRVAEDVRARLAQTRAGAEAA
jgi:hypothetical protein